MKKNLKNLLISLALCFSMACAAVGVLFSGSLFTAKADETYAVLDGFTIEETAAVRKTNPNGIRFTTNIDKALKDGDKISALSNAEYGTLLIPADFLGTEELTHNTEKVVDIKTTKWQDADKTTYTSVLAGTDGANLSETYYNRPIAARSYVRGTVGGTTVTYYTENTAVRSIGYVAYMAQSNNDTSELISDIVNKTNVEAAFTDTISAIQGAADGTAIVENKYAQSTSQAASIVVGGIAVPAEKISATYVSDTPDVISVNGNVLTAVGNGSANVTATISFAGKEYTVSKVMSTENYFPKTEYKILISKAAAAAQMNSSTSYVPAQDTAAYDAYYNAFEKTAAYQLQKILKEATGIELPIVTEQEAGVKYISVGETALASSVDVEGLAATEARVQVVNGNVIIRGGAQEGVLYGVQRWLYDVAGYEYYMENSYKVNEGVEIVSANDVTYMRDIDYNVTQSGKLDSQGSLDEYGMASYTEKIIPLGLTDAQKANNESYKGVGHNSTRVVAMIAGSANNYAGVGDAEKKSPVGASVYYAPTYDNNQSAYQKWFATYKAKTNMFGSSVDLYHVIANPYYKSGATGLEGYENIRAELCYTAHGDSTAYNAMVEAIANEMFNEMKNFPEYNRLGFSQADHRIWCECSTCAMETPTDNLLHFLLDVSASLKTKLMDAGDDRAETFKISTLFYHATNTAPTAEKYNNDELAYMEHIEVWFAETSADHIDAYKLTDDEKSYISLNNKGNNVNTAIFDNITAWSNFCEANGATDMLWWGYYANTTSSFIPFNTIDALRRNYASASNLGIDYMFNQMMEFQTNFASLKYYLMSKLTINAKPDDPTWNAWIDSYFEGSYGPGAAGMKAYYNAWYDLTNSDAVKDKFRLDRAYDSMSGDGASIGVDARTWTTVFTEVELNKWILSIDDAISALDVNDPNYETYYRNIMLEKLVPMYLLMYMHGGYNSSRGTFSNTTHVNMYGKEFATWVADWKMSYDGEGDTRTLAPFLTAIEKVVGTGSTKVTKTAVSDLIIAEINKDVTLYSAGLEEGVYTLTSGLRATTSVTVTTAGQVTFAVGNVAVGEHYVVTLIHENGNIVVFENVVAATAALASDADAVEGSNGYYIIDKTYYIEEEVSTNVALTHNIFQKGDYSVTANGVTSSKTVFYTGSMKVTVDAMMNGQETKVIVTDDNNNTYVFNVVAAKFIRTAEELKALGVGGRTNPDTGVQWGNYNSEVAGNDVTGIYVLANDIDASGLVFAAGYNRGESYFKATLDGNGYTVSNITVNEGGIFGGMYGATVKNIRFTNVKYDDSLGQKYGENWSNYTALFAHNARNTTIKDVEIYATRVASSNSRVLLEGLFVASNQDNVIYENITVNAHGLALETVLGSNITDAKYSNVVINASSFVAIGYTGNEFLASDTSQQNTAALLTAWPTGVTFNVTSNTFAITNTEETIMAGGSLAITTDKAYTYTYTLKEEVKGVSIEGNVVTVADSVSVGKTFTVYVTEAQGWMEEITLTVTKQVKVFDTVYTVEAAFDTNVTLPETAGTIWTVKFGDFVAYDKDNGIGTLGDGFVTPNSMPVLREHLGKGLVYEIETSNAIYVGSINVYTQIINTKEEFNNFETVAADNSVKAGYVIEEQKYAYLSGYFVLGNNIEYNDVWYPALSYATSNNPGGLKKTSVYALCNKTNSNVMGWIETYGADKVIAMNGWTDTETGGFHATLDGDGYVINGFETSGAYNGLSVLGGTNGVIKNIAFKNAKVGADAQLFFSYNKSTFENVYVQLTSIESASSVEATTVIGFNDHGAQEVKNVIVDATACNFSGMSKIHLVDLNRCNANGVYVIAGNELPLTNTGSDKLGAFNGYSETGDKAAMFTSVAALLADGTHGAIVDAFPSSFWTVDRENNIVCPNELYAEFGTVELNETITIEQVSGSFVLPNGVEGNATKVTIGSTVFTEINGTTVAFGSNDFVAMSDLGEGVVVVIESDNGRRYVASANVYTMIINTKAELDQWQSVAADNAVKAGLVIEEQKEAILSGYFALGANIEYNDTWKPIRTYGNIWQILDKSGSVGKTVVDKEGAIFEEWGAGNKAGFKGVFDGNGHYIHGMAITGEHDGFIVTNGGGTIKDVAFTGAIIGAASGFVTNRGPGAIENVYVQVDSIASGTDKGNFTTVITRYGNAGKILRNIVVDMTSADLSGLIYAAVSTLAVDGTAGIYVIGADELFLAKQEFTVNANIEGQKTEEDAKQAVVFLHYNAYSGSADYDIAGSFATAADLMADATHGAYVSENFSSDFWSVTAERVVPICLAMQNNYEASNRVTVDLGYAVSGTAVTQATTTTIDISEVSKFISGQEITITFNSEVIYEGTVSGNSVTLDSALISGYGDSQLVIEYSNGKIYLPIYIDDTIELNQANVNTSPANLKAILNSKLDGHFVLTSHLNMGGYNLQAIDVFTGILDGNGYGITNTYINVNGNGTDGTTNEAWSPNFIYKNTGTIKNIYFEISDFDWTNGSSDSWHGNGYQGIIAENEGLIENVYADITLKHSAVSANTRGLLTRSNNGTIRNVIVNVHIADGKTLYKNTIAAISYYNSTTIENAYVVTNGIANLIGVGAGTTNTYTAVETIADLPTATITGWGDMWSNSNSDVLVFGKGYLLDGSNTLITFGSNGLDVPVYTGDAAAMGFVNGAPVYAAPMTSSWSDRIVIGGSKTADYMVFDFAVAKVSGNMTVWLHRNKSLMGGYSYVLSAKGGVAINEGTSSKAFYIVDQNGDFVTSDISAETKYTMYVHLGGDVEVDGIMLGCAYETFYISNVRYVNGSEDYWIETNNGSSTMSFYTGDAGDLGFENGSFVQQMVTQDLVEGSQWWETSDGYAPNLHRQTYKAYIAADGTQKTMSIDFVLSEEIASGNVFYVWGEGVASGGAFGSVSVNRYDEGTTGNGFMAGITDQNGSPVTSLKANTVYTLSMYMPGATSYNVGNIAASGMTTYFSLSSIRTNDVEPIFIKKTSTSRILLPEYRGDVTALGFAAGTTVYTAVQDTRTSMWSAGSTLGLDMAAQTIELYKTAEEDYVSVQFSVSRAFTGTYAFFTWAYKADDTGLNEKQTAGYLTAAGAASDVPTGANVYAFDLETGLRATSFVPGKAYELRWYGEEIVNFKLGCCEANGEPITIYYANRTSGSDPATQPTGDVVYDRYDKALDYYYGDVTALGFAAGTAVYGRVQDNRSNVWAPNNTGDLGLTMEQQCIKITKTAEDDYASIQFALSRDLTHPSYAFFAWCFDENGNCTTVHLLKNGTGSGGDITVQVYNLDGTVATNIVAGKAYEMRWYSATNVRFQIGCYESNGEYITTYFANPTVGNDA